MQCPECNHIPLAGNQPDPTRCPECGIFYEKAIALRKARLSAAPPKLPMNPGAYEVDYVKKLYPGAHPVVLVDIQMSFGSMIKFMVKWALASIPAIIILFVLFFVLLAAFGLSSRFL